MQDNKKNTVRQPDASDCNAMFDGHTNFDVIMTCQQDWKSRRVSMTAWNISIHIRERIKRNLQRIHKTAAQDEKYATATWSTTEPYRRGLFDKQRKHSLFSSLPHPVFEVQWHAQSLCCASSITNSYHSWSQCERECERISQPRHQEVNTTLMIWKGRPDTYPTSWLRQTSASRGSLRLRNW